jgi:hypothetical protein
MTWSLPCSPSARRHIEPVVGQPARVLLSLFNAGAGAGGGGRDFSYGLRRAHLGLILSGPYYSRWFAQAYAGADD